MWNWFIYSVLVDYHFNISSAFLESYPSIKECTLVDGSEYMLDFTEGLLSAKNAALSIASYSSLLSLLEKVQQFICMFILEREKC